MNYDQCIEFSNSTVDQAIQSFSGYVQVESTAQQSLCPTCGFWYYGAHLCYGSYPSWYPSYWYYHVDKTSTAMKVIRHLMEKKVVIIKTVPEFISIVDEIATLL